MFVFPDETYTPFHVNGNRMLPGPITLQRVKAVRRRIAKVIERSGAIEQFELVQRAILDVRRQLPAPFAVPDFFGFGIRKRANHVRTFHRLGDTKVEGSSD
jgi:hypothetical protein